MSSDSKGKPPGRVEVLHFPKRVRPRRATAETVSGRSAGETVTRRLELDAEETVPGHHVADEPRSVRRIPKRLPAHAESTDRRRTRTPDWLVAHSEVTERTTDRRRTRTPEGLSAPGDLDRRRTRTPEIPQVDTDPGRRRRAMQPGPTGELTPERAAELSLFGHRLFENGRVQEARAVFEGLVGMGVADAFPHTMLGTVYLALRDPDRALALFEAALAYDEGDLAARVYRGEIRLNRGRYRLAVADLQRAIELGDADDPFVDRARRLLKAARERQRRRK